MKGGKNEEKKGGKRGEKNGGKNVGKKVGKKGVVQYAQQRRHSPK